MITMESVPEKVEEISPSSLRTPRTETPVILHVDVDAFECQVHSRNNPEFKSSDPFVVAHNTGRIVSVSYPARECGITRDLRTDEARKLAENLKVITIPFHHRWGKSCNKIARHASQQLLDDGVLPYQMLNPEIVINFASSDEFFIDITQLVTKRMAMANNFPPKFSKNMFLEGAKCFFSEDNLNQRLETVYNIPRNEMSEPYRNDLRLMFGGIIAEELSDQIWKGVKFDVSCGVGNNKLLAKLATSLHKPKGITILPPEAIDRLSKDIKVDAIPGLGGKRGQHLQQTLGVETMWDLQQKTATDITTSFAGMEDMGTEQSVLEFSEKVVEWSFGIESDEVLEKLYKERINCGKAIPKGFSNFQKFRRQVNYLIEEMMERVREEKFRVESMMRLPTSFRLEVEFFDTETEKSSRTGYTFPYHDMKKNKILTMAIDGLLNEFGTTETINCKNIRKLNFIATKLEAMTEAEHANLDHDENSTCRIYKNKQKKNKLKMKRRKLPNNNSEIECQPSVLV